MECIDVLKGGGPADVRELSVELSAWMFYLGEKTSSVDEGANLPEEHDRQRQGAGKIQAVRSLAGRRRARHRRAGFAAQRRRLVKLSPVPRADCDGHQLRTVWRGAGHAGRRPRNQGRSSIDHAVGLEFHKRIGDRVEKGEPLATIHYNSGTKLDEAKRLVAESFVIRRRDMSRMQSR